MNPNDIDIRTAGLDDAEEILSIYAPYVTKTAITFEYEVPDLREWEERMKRTLKLINAGINSEPGTTWFGWRKRLGRTDRSRCPSLLFRI